MYPPGYWTLALIYVTLFAVAACGVYALVNLLT